MGGHGALICALKNPGKYQTVSAFAPICNPSECPWGKKALSGYLGQDGEATEWGQWDATCLVSKYDGPPLDIFIDQVSKLILGNMYCNVNIITLLLINSSVSIVCSQVQKTLCGCLRI